MLVLYRKVGEKLVIGNEVVIEVLSVSGDGVRLGIEAPRSTSVHRYEVFVEIQNANQDASTVEIDASSLENIAKRLKKK
jgi:carbon storage regulator